MMAARIVTPADPSMILIVGEIPGLSITGMPGCRQIDGLDVPYRSH
jgi:hypothetical protein